MIVGSIAGSGSVLRTNGSGSGRPKNKGSWFGSATRIHNTDKKHFICRSMRNSVWVSRTRAQHPRFVRCVAGIFRQRRCWSMPPTVGAPVGLPALQVRQQSKSNFTQKKGLEKGLRRCSAAAQSTCRIWPGNKRLPPTPCFLHRVHTKLPVFREGALVPSFVYT